MSLEPPPPALQVKLLSPTAKPPTRGSAYAAGYDLYASKEAVVPARGKVLVDTDISIAVPINTYGRVAPRSGLASKHSIDTGAGVIDADYRGPVKVLLFNLSDVDFHVAVGERVAQLIIERVSCSGKGYEEPADDEDRFIPQMYSLLSNLRRLFVGREVLARLVDLEDNCLLLVRVDSRRSENRLTKSSRPSMCRI
jgi:deoxyuridine 5'-triphosphate nucleotidohydrolase